MTDKIDHIRSLNFNGKRAQFTRRDNPLAYYFDRHGYLYRDGVSDFTCRADDASDGAVMRRLTAIYRIHALVGCAASIAGRVSAAVCAVVAGYRCCTAIAEWVDDVRPRSHWE